MIEPPRWLIMWGSTAHADQERAGEVDVLYTLPLGNRDEMHRPATRDTGGGDEDVDACRHTCTASSTICFCASASRTSSEWNSAAFADCSTAAHTSVVLMSEPMTMAPSAAKRSAQAKPIPDAAPVTYTTLPSRRPMLFPPFARSWGNTRGCGACEWRGWTALRGGWVVVTSPITGGPSTVECVAGLDQLIERVRTGEVRAAGIDMPIGLPSRTRHTSDGQLRVHLGARRSSIFPTPHRVVLDAVDYRDALARARDATGVGLSKQAWNLVGKIRELDALMTRSCNARQRSGPESSFAELAGKPLVRGKTTREGREERTRLLLHSFPDVAEHVARHGGIAVDVLDALAPRGPRDASPTAPRKGTATTIATHVVCV